MKNLGSQSLSWKSFQSKKKEINNLTVASIVTAMPGWHTGYWTINKGSVFRPMVGKNVSGRTSSNNNQEPRA